MKNPLLRIIFSCLIGSIILLTLCFPLAAQPTYKEKLKQVTALSRSEMRDVAIRTTRVLEASIQEVIHYGQKNQNADILIKDNILPFFIPGATIQSASCTKTGKYYGDPADVHAYFESLYRKGKRTPSLKVYFSDIDVQKIEPNRYKCKVHYVQEWQSKPYNDQTIKEMEIHFVETNGVFVAKIGSIGVFSINCN